MNKRTNKINALIVYNSFSLTHSTEFKIKRFIEEGKKLNISFDCISTLETGLIYKNGKYIFKGLKEKFNKDITKYDFCIFLDKDKYLAEAISKTIIMFDNHLAIRLCDDKMETYLALNKIENLLTPKVIPAPLCYNPNLSEEEKNKFTRFITKELSFPLVCKESFGSLGKQVFLIKNKEELNNIYQELYNKPHLYSEYINYEFGTDYRIIVVGKNVVACMKRVNENDFRSNIALGGKGYIYSDLNNEAKKMILKIVSTLKLDYCGIDLVKINEKDYALIEVNSNAFFEEIEKVTSLNIAKIYLEYILKKLKKI